MKTPTIIGLAAVVLGSGGLIVLLILTGHDPSSLVGELPLLAAVAASLFGLDKVVRNTNGTLSDLQAKNDALTAENAALRSVATPAQITQVAPIIPDTAATATQPAKPIADPISATPLPDPLNVNGSGATDATK